MKKSVAAAILTLSLLAVQPAFTATAASKPKTTINTTMVALPKLVEAPFFQGAGGGWSETLISKRGIYLVGSSEPTGAPTQGEVISIDPRTGATLWDLPIPSVSDAIATAAILDPSGNIWVAGSAAQTSETPVPTPVPTPSGILNPSGVVITSHPPTRAGLTEISLWEISPAGQLIASYQYDAKTVVLPESILYSKNSFQIVGRDFSIAMDRLGNFSKLIVAQPVPKKTITTVNFKDGLYIWKSYLSKSVIAGVSGWKPTSPGQVVLKVGGRTGHIYGAFKVTNNLLKIDFLIGVGVVVTSSNANGYVISLLK